MPKAKKFRTFIGRMEEKDGICTAVRLCDDVACATFLEARKKAKELFKQKALLGEGCVAFVTAEDHGALILAGIRRECVSNFGEGFRVDVTPDLTKAANALVVAQGRALVMAQ